MLRKFVSMVNETIDKAYEEGIHRFMEGLEEDFEKEEVLETTGSTDVLVKMLMEEAGFASEDDGEETLSQIISEMYQAEGSSVDPTESTEKEQKSE